jgi:hypothetical protein
MQLCRPAKGVDIADGQHRPGGHAPFRRSALPNVLTRETYSQEVSSARFSPRYEAFPQAVLILLCLSRTGALPRPAGTSGANDLLRRAHPALRHGSAAGLLAGHYTAAARPVVGIAALESPALTFSSTVMAVRETELKLAQFHRQQLTALGCAPF